MMIKTGKKILKFPPRVHGRARLPASRPANQAMSKTFRGQSDGSEALTKVLLDTWSTLLGQSWLTGRGTIIPYGLPLLFFQKLPEGPNRGRLV